MVTKASAKVKPPSEQIVDEFDQKAVLAAGPKLKPYQQLRAGQRGVFLSLAEEFMPKGPDGKPAKVDPAAPPPTEVDMTTAEVYETLDKIDRALESVAEDPEEYDRWATGDNLERRLMELFRAYAADLGNSTGSAN